MRITWWDKEFSSSHFWTNSKNWRWLMTLQKLTMALRLSSLKNTTIHISYGYFLWFWNNWKMINCSVSCLNTIITKIFIFDDLSFYLTLIYYCHNYFQRHFIEAFQKMTMFLKVCLSHWKDQIFYRFSRYRK